MITYRVAFIDDEAKVYSKAKEFFSNRNIGNDEFHIELVNISKLSDIEIRSMHFHSVIYDIDKTIDTSNDDVLASLLQSKASIDDLKIFPLSQLKVTRETAQQETERLSSLRDKSDQVQAIPINVSQENDLKAVFQAVEVASAEYRSLASQVLERDRAEYEMTAKTLVEAMEEKSPYTASHFKQVGMLSEAIARSMGKDEEEVQKTKSIAILHDAGKLLMPAELLNNPHMTVGNERDQMALHAELGEVVLAQNLLDLEERGGVVDHHNSKTDNKYAKIIAVADCIDTMTSQRAYNNPKAIQEVFRDIVKNMHDRSFIDENGKTVISPAQFDREAAIAAIVMLANELGSIGYDVRKLLKPTSNQWNKTQDEELVQILTENASKIIINLSAKEGAYTSLGFRLSDTGHLEFESRPAAVISRETRLRSEYEFAIFKNSTEEQRENAKTIMDLESNFSEDELEIFRRLAEGRIIGEDEKGRESVQAGKVMYSKETQGQDSTKTRPAQIVEVAKEDRDFNRNGAQKFLNEVTRLNPKDLERKEGRGA